MSLLSEKIYFIAGVGTDIGKTFFVEKICKSLVAKKEKVKAIKPISSGFLDDDLNSDYGRILSAIDENLSVEALQNRIEEISPWRFKEPVSPHFAGKENSKEISFDAVKNFCLAEIEAAKKSQSYLFIEAAGGLMTPINFQKHFLDLAAELKIPLILITANYLGAISHSLTALEAAKSYAVSVAAIVVNDSLENSEMKVSGYAINETLSAFSEVKVLNFSDLF